MQRVDIFKAAHTGNLDGVRTELCCGVDPNAYSRGQTALMLASEKGHANVCELLIGNGAKVDAVDAYNRTALYQAVVFNHVECARVLVSHGASSEPRSWLGGENAQDIAKLRSNVEIQRLFQTAATSSKPSSPVKAIKPSSSSGVESRALVEGASTVNNYNSIGASETRVALPAAVSFPRKAPAPEVDESARPEPLIKGTRL